MGDWQLEGGNDRLHLTKWIAVEINVMFCIWIWKSQWCTKRLGTGVGIYLRSSSYEKDLGINWLQLTVYCNPPKSSAVLGCINKDRVFRTRQVTPVLGSKLWKEMTKDGHRMEVGVFQSLPQITKEQERFSLDKALLEDLKAVRNFCALGTNLLLVKRYKRIWGVKVTGNLK